MNNHHLLNTTQLQLDFLGIPELASAVNDSLEATEASPASPPCVVWSVPVQVPRDSGTWLDRSGKI